MSEPAIVCLVDDDESVRIALLRLLKSAGYRARAFASAQALLAEPPPDDAPVVVLTDLRMPGIDGMELARKLSAYPVPPPIVFLSAHGDVPASVKAMKDGAVDFLEKPVQEEDLFDALERAVARSRQESFQRRGLAGLINKEVAWELGISEKTIKVHRARVVEKMGARSLPDLVRMAGRLGIPSDRPPENAPARAG